MAENNDVDLNLGAAVLQYMIESNNAIDIPMSFDTNSTLYRAGGSDVNAGAEQLVADQQDLSATLTEEQMAALEDFASNADMIPADELAEIQAQLVQVDRGPDGAMISGEKTSPDFKAGFGEDVQVLDAVLDINPADLTPMDEPTPTMTVDDLLDINPADLTPMDEPNTLPVDVIIDAMQTDGWTAITGTGDSVLASAMDANDGSWEPVVSGSDPDMVLETANTQGFSLGN